MKYCHECGSEVANLDLFCPYCGISQPTPDDAVQADDPFASTIMISSAGPPELSERLLNTDPKDKSSENILSDTDKNIRFDAATEESIRVDTASVETEPILSELEPEKEIAVTSDGSDIPLILETDPAIIIADIPTPILLNNEELAEYEEESSENSLGDDIDDLNIPKNLNEDIRLEAEQEVPEKLIAHETAPAETQPETTDDGSPEVAVEEVSTIENASVESGDAAEDVAKKHLVESDWKEIDDESESIEFKSEDQDEESKDEKSGELSLESPIPVAEAAVGSTEAETEVTPEPDEVSEDQTPDVKAETSDQTAVSEESSGEPDLSDIDEFDLDKGTGDEPVVADTGDDLGGDEPRSHTSPQMGTADTDGRKSGLKPLAEGTILNNRYDIVRKIGGGGMGAVYLATDRNLGGVTRAVKEMVQSHIEEEQQAKAIDDFKRESMILSSLDHPSIPTIYDYFFDERESRFYLVMKYISGGDLAGRLRAAPEGRIDERTVVEWALQVIDVLDYLHNLPSTIVYRDLKPSNIMIDGNTGRTMLIDFGIARSINQNQEKGVTAVGTMGYAPPELFSGNVEPRSDIYSLGSTMFHLLTGADPQNNPLLIFDFQKNPRPRQINPQLSDQIERILMRSVEYNADSRFSSAAEMKRALGDHLESLKIGQITFGVTEIPQSISLSNQVVFCGFCGQRIVATDMFCAFCGSKQPLAQHGVHSEVYSSRSVGTAKLVLMGTTDLDSPAYSIEKQENLVGRRDPMSNIFPEVDLSRYDPQTKISRRHAKIWRDGQNYLVEDLGSSNGTLLLTSINDTMRLLPNQPHPLANGDRLRVGDTTLHFIVG